MASIGKSDLELFDEITMNLLSLLGSLPGCVATLRKLEHEYQQMLGTPIPRVKGKSTVDIIRMSPTYFDVRQSPNGFDYEVALVRHATTQGYNIAEWNSHSAESRQRGRRRQEELAVKNPKPIQLLDESIKLFRQAVMSILQKNLTNGCSCITVDDLMDSNHPDISKVNPSRYGVSGFLELLQLLAGSEFGLDVINGVVVVVQK